MQRSKRYIVEGAALGAILGMMVGWLYSRRVGDEVEEGEEIDTKHMMHLVWSGLGFVRQIAEL